MLEKAKWIIRQPDCDAAKRLILWSLSANNALMKSYQVFHKIFYACAILEAHRLFQLKHATHHENAQQKSVSCDTATLVTERVGAPRTSACHSGVWYCALDEPQERRATAKSQNEPADSQEDVFRSEA